MGISSNLVYVCIPANARERSAKETRVLWIKDGILLIFVNYMFEFNIRDRCYFVCYDVCERPNSTKSYTGKSFVLSKSLLILFRFEVLDPLPTPLCRLWSSWSPDIILLWIFRIYSTTFVGVLNPCLMEILICEYSGGLD